MACLVTEPGYDPVSQRFGVFDNRQYRARRTHHRGGSAGAGDARGIAGRVPFRRPDRQGCRAVSHLHGGG